MPNTPAAQIRSAVLAFVKDRVRAELDITRGGESTFVELVDTHAWLLGSSGSDTLREALQSGAISGGEAESVQRHVTDLRRLAHTAKTHDGFARLAEREVPTIGLSVRETLKRATDPRDPEREQRARALVAVAEAVAPRAMEAVFRADEACARPPAVASPLSHAAGDDAQHDKNGEEELDASARAEAWLTATDPLLEGTLDRLGVQETSHWSSLLASLRALPLSAQFSARGRQDRVASVARGLGLGDALSRVQLEQNAPSLRRTPSVIALDPPRDVRLSCGPMRDDLNQEIELARAVGHGIAVAMTPPADPPLMRFPPRSGELATYLLGAVMADLVTHRVRLRRSGRLSEREQVEAHVLGAQLNLLATRMAAAGVLLAEGERFHAEAAAEAARRALGLWLPAPVAQIALSVPSHHVARWETRVSALAAGAAFRERLDEDWFRNPRALGVLSASQHVGRTESVRRWLDELGICSETERDEAALAELSAPLR